MQTLKTQCKKMAHNGERRFAGFVFVFYIVSTTLPVRADDSVGLYSKSIANFLRIQQELKNKPVEATSPIEGDVERRADVLNPAHEGWSGHFFHHLKTQNVPDFGHHEIHSMDERGESFHLDSTPRHHVHHGHHGHHHMPHHHHEVHTFHHDGEHPHISHEHYVHHEPVYHHMSMFHHDDHHGGHHDDDEESGDHEEHHEEETMHGDTDDWDVGGGYFQVCLFLFLCTI